MNKTTPYTYLIKHIPTNTFYYGCKYAKGCHPSTFWIDYWTSSKYVNVLIEETGKESFEFEIRKVFTDVNVCRNWESKVLKRMKVVQREDFINRTDNISIDPICAALGLINRIVTEKSRSASKTVGLANKGKKRTVTQRETISKALIGNTYKLGVKESQESCEKKRQMRLGKSSGMKGKTHTDEAKSKQGHIGEDHWNYGKHHSEETLEKMRKPRGPQKAKSIRIERTCPYCKLTGKGPNMARYHFDNCKLKEN